MGSDSMDRSARADRCDRTGVVCVRVGNTEDTGREENYIEEFVFAGEISCNKSSENHPDTLGLTHVFESVGSVMLPAPGYKRKIN